MRNGYGHSGATNALAAEPGENSMPCSASMESDLLFVFVATIQPDDETSLTPSYYDAHILLPQRSINGYIAFMLCSHLQLMV